MSVLILDENDSLSKIYSMNIKVYTNQEVIICKSVSELMSLIKRDGEVNVIVSGSSFNNKKVFELIYKGLSGSLDALLFICTNKIDYSHYYPEVVFIEDDSDLKLMISSIAKHLNVTAKDMASLKLESFYPIDKSFLIHSIPYCADLYLKKENTYKIFLKKGKSMSRDVYELLCSDDSSNLYTESLDRLKLINGISRGLVDMLSSNSLSGDERDAVTSQGFSSLDKSVSSLGITDSTIKLADATVDSMRSIVKSSKSMSSLLDNLLDNEETFKYQHAMTTIYIGSKIIEEAEWGSKEQLKSLSYIALFADIVINDDKLARIQSHEELISADLTEHEIAIINTHALRSFALFSKFRRGPIGVATMIKQHHGSRKGIGLKMDSFNIAPIGLIFMIASSFASDSIKSRELGHKIDKDDYVSLLRDKFGENPKFKEYIYHFEKITI